MGFSRQEHWSGLPLKKIRDTKGTLHATVGTVRDRNSKDPTEAEDIKKRWQEYTKELYKKDLDNPDNHDGLITHLEPDILEGEVKWALGSITMNKASGGDGIPAGLFQILKDDAVKVLHSMCQQIWKTQQWPQDWKRSVFIPIPKKGIAKECSNYRTIALISHVSKVMLKILQARLQKYVNRELPDDQARFRKGRGNREQMTNVHWIIEKAREFQKNIYFCFIDYTKAFDCVDHNKLWNILKEMGVPAHLTCLLRNLYAGQEAIVRTGPGTMDWFQIGKVKGVFDSLQPYGLHSPWNSQGQNTGVGSFSLLQGIFPTKRSNLCLPHCRQILYQLSHQGSPRKLEWIAYPFSRGSFWPRNWTRVSYIAGGFFTRWTTREAQKEYITLLI